MFGVENVIDYFVDVMIMMEMKLIVVERGTWMVSNTVLMDTSGLTGKSKRGCVGLCMGRQRAIWMINSKG